LVEYGLLALAFAFAWNHQPAAADHAGILAVASAACVALVDGVYQSTVPNRYPSFGDISWDWLGALLAVALLHLYRLSVWKRQPRILTRA
jgi:VanZ family protein